ncbi:LOW QUALITY PROTEIN: protein angel homolog 1-like [Polymixia lowei]
MSYYPPLQQTLHCSYYLPLPSEGVWRVWEELSEIATAADAAQSSFPDHEALFDFTVMSYNVMAQDLLETNQELYSHCPLEVLNWSYRCHLLIEEIQKYAPDILCLQEVQENHYMEQLLPVLSQMGYTCVYKCRTGTKTDGCATCYRGNRFSELSVSLLEFRRVETGLLDRDNVGIVVLLQPVVTQGSGRVKASPLCVANTHLLFNPRRGDVKLAQLAIVLAEINNMVESCMATGDQCNVILCGDFNSVPHMPLYQLITTGQLFYHGLAAWMISGQEDLSYKAHHYRLFAPLWPSSLGITDTCQYSTGKEKLPSQTQESAHEHTLPGSGQSEVTTLHSEVGATVDYIFYTPKHVQKDDGQLVRGGLKMIGRLSLLSEEDLWAMRGLPNEIFPSDHLSLLAKFRLDLSPA